jgi:hypothetical protein
VLASLAMLARDRARCAWLRVALLLPSPALRAVSMAARNSPKSSGRSSPLYSDSVTAKSPRWFDIGEGIEVEIDNLLKRLGGGAVAQAFGQGVGPSGILGL